MARLTPQQIELGLLALKSVKLPERLRLTLIDLLNAQATTGESEGDLVAILPTNQRDNVFTTANDIRRLQDDIMQTALTRLSGVRHGDS